MPRTDAHRPSAINPAEYHYVACDYYGQTWGRDPFIEQERKNLRAHMERTGGRYAHKYNAGTCHICGAVALTVFKYHHESSNTYIVTGEDCAYKMEIGDPKVFKAVRRHIVNGRKVGKGKALAAETLALLGLSDAYRVYEAGYHMNEVNTRKQEEIVISIVGKLVKYRTMSEKQVELVRKLVSDIADRPRREAEAAARRAEEVAKAEWIGTIGERVDLDLTVAFRTSFETQFGICHVHSMRDAAGNVVVYKGNRIAEKGQRITMKATIKEHAVYKDLKQTVVSRPKVGAVV